MTKNSCKDAQESGKYVENCMTEKIKSFVDGAQRCCLKLKVSKI